MPSDAARPNVRSLLTMLSQHGVEFVLTGSVAAMAYGVTLVPSDLDIAPALDRDNLQRLATLLRELTAKPKYVPSWTRGLSREECDRWEPKPADERNLDHRFVTSQGELDVVPRLAGEYSDLASRAVPMIAFGMPCLVAHLDDLILPCRKWSREADRQRLPELLAARARFDGGNTSGDVGERLTTA